MNQEALLSVATQAFGIEECSELEGTDSLVYATAQDGIGAILKITPSIYRDLEAIRAEALVVNHLAHHGAPVARAFPTKNWQYAVPVGDGFTAALFERIDGKEVDEEDTSPEMLTRWGHLLGRLHFLINHEEPPVFLRHQWHEEALITHIERHVPADLQPNLARAKTLLQRIHTFPKSENNFGVVHADFHAGNMLDLHGTLHAIDFCDCRFHWFMFDIARALYAATPSLIEARDFAPHFMEHFLRGYRQHLQPSAEDLNHLPDFFKLHDLEQLGMMYVPSFLTGEGLEWTDGLLHSRERRWERLVSDVGLLDGLDFSRFV
jgi:amicoumacin kinase